MIWPLVPLENVAQISGGSTPKRNNDSYWNGDIPWVTPSDLSAPGALVFNVEDTNERITQEGLNSCSAPLLPPETVLFSPRKTIGKIGIAKVPLATNQGFANFIPKPSVRPKYLAYALRYFTPQIMAQAVSTTFKEVRRDAIRKFQIPLPPPSEQQRIIEILDMADALQRSRVEAYDKMYHILPSLFIRMFGDPTTNPMGWSTGIIDDVISETQYGISKKANSDQNGTPILRMHNIDIRGLVDLSNLKFVDIEQKVRRKYFLKSGDILFNRTNSKEHVGKTGLWKGQMKAVPDSYLIRIRVNREKVLPEFLWGYMNTQFMKQMLFNKAHRTIGMASINTKELRAFPVIIPDEQLQQLFARKISSVDKYFHAVDDARVRQDKMLHVLSHHAFSGELTARWRDAHIDSLLQEAKEQAATLATVCAGKSTNSSCSQPRKAVP